MQKYIWLNLKKKKQHCIKVVGFPRPPNKVKNILKPPNQKMELKLMPVNGLLSGHGYTGMKKTI